MLYEGTSNSINIYQKSGLNESVSFTNAVRRAIDLIAWYIL